MTTTAVLVGLAFLIGVLIGCVAPGFVQLWKISQVSYAMGYRARGFVAGVHVKRAQRFLACEHFPALPDGGPVCRKCASRARAALGDALIVDETTQPSRLR